VPYAYYRILCAVLTAAVPWPCVHQAAAGHLSVHKQVTVSSATMSQSQTAIIVSIRVTVAEWLHPTSGRHLQSVQQMQCNVQLDSIRFRLLVPRRPSRRTDRRWQRHCRHLRGTIGGHRPPADRCGPQASRQSMQSMQHPRRPPRSPIRASAPDRPAALTGPGAQGCTKAVRAMPPLKRRQRHPSDSISKDGRTSKPTK
jgi:hypothetical protein